MNAEGKTAIQQIQNVNLDPEIYQLSNSLVLFEFKTVTFFRNFCRITLT